MLWPKYDQPARATIVPALDPLGECSLTEPEIVERCEGLSLDEPYGIYRLMFPVNRHPAGSIIVWTPTRYWIEPREDNIVLSLRDEPPGQVQPYLTAGAIGCVMCPLASSRQSVVEGTGPYGGLMVIGEAPGREEDAAGVPFIGQSGKLLVAYLAELGLQPTTYYLTNAVRCRPPDNRNPTTGELEACRYWLEEEIQRVRPTAVLALGKVAQAQIAGVGGLSARVFEALHPAYLLRNPARRPEWRRQLAEVRDYLNGGRPPQGDWLLGLNPLDPLPPQRTGSQASPTGTPPGSP